jgi:hypothetical protein
MLLSDRRQGKLEHPIRLHQHAAYLRRSIVKGCSMELLIPDGAQVHITVGVPPLLALPHDPPAVASPIDRPHGRTAKGLLTGVLLIGAVQVRRFLPHHAETASAARSPTASAVSAVTESNTAAEIPRAFRTQMAQPPQLTPPPGVAAPVSGSPAAAPSAAPNPFGLQG